MSNLQRPSGISSYVEWLAKNPMPELDELRLAAGGYYSAITREQWIEYDLAMADWEARRRDNLLGGMTWRLAATITAEKKSKKIK